MENKILYVTPQARVINAWIEGVVCTSGSGEDHTWETAIAPILLEPEQL